ISAPVPKPSHSRIASRPSISEDEEQKEEGESERMSERTYGEEDEPEAEGEREDDPDGRNDWFTCQRTYPGDSIPADARRKAWAAASRIKLESFAAEAAQEWRSIGPSPSNPTFPNWGLTSGRVNSVAVSPSNSRIVLAGSSTGGIWRSSDSGASFAPV